MAIVLLSFRPHSRPYYQWPGTKYAVQLLPLQRGQVWVSCVVSSSALDVQTPVMISTAVTTVDHHTMTAVIFIFACVFVRFDF
jgi:hypothetical protein